MTTKSHQLRPRVASGIWLSESADPKNAELSADELQAKIDARIREATANLPEFSNASLRKYKRSIYLSNIHCYHKLQLIGQCGSLRKRRRFNAMVLRWHIEND